MQKTSTAHEYVAIEVQVKCDFDIYSYILVN